MYYIYVTFGPSLLTEYYRLRDIDEANRYFSSSNSLSLSCYCLVSVCLTVSVSLCNCLYSLHTSRLFRLSAVIPLAGRWWLPQLRFRHYLECLTYALLTCARVCDEQIDAQSYTRFRSGDDEGWLPPPPGVYSLPHKLAYIIEPQFCHPLSECIITETLIHTLYMYIHKHSNFLVELINVRLTPIIRHTMPGPTINAYSTINTVPFPSSHPYFDIIFEAKVLPTLQITATLNY